MTNRSDDARARSRRNAASALVFLAISLVMVGAAFAAVPVYKRFCQATGFGGTVKRASLVSGPVLNKTVTVTFDTNVRDLPWTFTAEDRSQEVTLGKASMTTFKVTNNSPAALTGRASYNVLPASAGAYLTKIQCFCFSNQTLQPGQTIEFPVIFYIAAGYAADLNTQDNPNVTLSYTFFPVKDSSLNAAAAGKGG